MKTLLAPLLAALSLGLALAVPGARAPAPPGGDGEDLVGRVAAVRAEPPHVELDDRFAYAQLVLTGELDGELDGGGAFDVTRDAELVRESALVLVDERGLVRARPGAGPGEDELVFRVGGREIAVPVRIAARETPYEPGFRRDVMPILSKTGCTAGGCHGAADGQNGFKLSLRGYDPLADHAALTDDLAGRRFDPVAPERSLFLLKPTASVPHEGGQRLVPGSRDYEMLRDWVSGGARLDLDAPRVESIELWPAEPVIPRAGMSQQFGVRATYSDGSVRDVSAHAVVETSDTEITAADGRGLVTALRRGEAGVLARYEGRYASTRLFVMGDRAGFEWAAPAGWNVVDELVYEKLRKVRVLPGELCTDAEFLRRVTLDLTGQAPTPREVRTFLADRRDTRVKRDEAIERLIGSAAFVDHWTGKWADLLQVNGKFLGEEGARRFRDWIRAAVASNEPYDRFAADVLGASGSTYANPPAAYYKVLREPDVAMENTTQLFLGVRFNCNKCHDHPFERWTRDQHWRLAAYFGRVGRANAEGSPLMPRTAENQIDGDPPAFEELVTDLDEGEVRDPETDAVVPPDFPYEHAGDVPAELPRRARLARWVTAPENPYFATSYVNRVWSYFTGRGLIEPVDDIRAGNPPSNPALLERLTTDFVDSGFDVRALMRTICRSRTYQLSIATNEWNADDTVNYSHARARRLPAEVLYDALHRATGSLARLPGVRPGTRASELVDASVETPDGFLALFGRPPRESACECERSSGVSLGQALNLVNGETVAAAIRDEANDLTRLARYEKEPARLVEELYMAFLSRPPTPEETAALAGAFETAAIENRAALSPTHDAEIEQRLREWQASIRLPEWQVAMPTAARSLGGAELLLQPDGSVLASGAAPEKDTYTLVVQAEAGPITGLLLEALPHESFPSGGPGRAENGNFVLAELRVVAVPLDDPAASRPLVLQAASADFSQGGWPVGATLDGDPATGWAVMPRFGAAHQAVFETADDVGGAGGTVLVLTLEMPYGSMHTLGHLRVSTTSTPRPVRHHGLTEAVVSALRRPVEDRTEEDRAALWERFVSTHPGVDERLRVSAVQDLAWALANSPGFLFNR